MTFGGYSLHHSGLGLGSVYLSAQHNVSPTQVIEVVLWGRLFVRGQRGLRAEEQPELA